MSALFYHGAEDVCDGCEYQKQFIDGEGDPMLICTAPNGCEKVSDE